jgi:hypothetical protein
MLLYGKAALHFFSLQWDISLRVHWHTSFSAFLVHDILYLRYQRDRRKTPRSRGRKRGGCAEKHRIIVVYYLTNALYVKTFIEEAAYGMYVEKMS